MLFIINQARRLFVVYFITNKEIHGQIIKSKGTKKWKKVNF